MKIYKRGTHWWYRFQIGGRRVHESARTTSIAIARKAARRRMRELEESFNHLSKREMPPPFSVAATKWLNTKATITEKTAVSYRAALTNIKKHIGRIHLCDVEADDIATYQTARRKEGTGKRTIDIEVGVIRSVLRKYRQWERVADDVEFFREDSHIGRAISEEEETRLLKACAESRSRGLYPAVFLAINTGLRITELRTMRWCQVDFLGEAVTVGKAKTKAGTGRVVPLNQDSLAVFKHWHSQFPDALPEHFVFPREKYGLSGNTRKVCVWMLDPSRPVGSWKVAWTNARARAKVQCRFHDLRHSFVSRLAEGGASDSTIMALAGHISRSMLERYSHTRMEAKRVAVAGITKSGFDSVVAQKWPNAAVRESRRRGK